MRSASDGVSPRTLFIFVDESGNFDFTERGTRHFLMAGVVALSPYVSAIQMQDVRYRMLAAGHDVEYLHASEDRQVVRDEVFRAIASMTEIRAHVVWGDKHRAHPKIQEAGRFYSIFGKALVKFLLMVHTPNEYQQVVVIFDSALTSKQRGAFEAAIKPDLKAIGRPFRIFFHSVRTDYNGQIADYVGWAKYVQLERGEGRPWTALEPLRPTEFNIFRRGHSTYY